MTERGYPPMAMDAAAAGDIPAQGAGGDLSKVYSRPAPRPPRVAGRLLSSEYGELKQLVKQQGLLEKQPAYCARMVLITLSLLALVVAVLVLADSLWLRLLDAAALAFVSTQISFIGHDAGHQQFYRSGGRNDIILLGVSLLIGLDRTWWVEKHIQHHRNPNCLDLDPDINVSMLAFTEERALGKRGFNRFIVRHQAFFFYPILFLASVSFVFAGIHFLLTRGQAKYPVAEPLAVGAHLAVYLGLLFYLLEPWQAVLFIGVHQSLQGLYMGSVFAPNHKGMPVLDASSQLNFLRKQVLTARNVKPNPVSDFCYGGLNYQIEHHLFPSMARNKLWEARKIVKEFCRARSIPYHETGILGSQREILGYLHRVSAPLRS
jgi:fatty acid desaturase